MNLKAKSSGNVTHISIYGVRGQKPNLKTLRASHPTHNEFSSLRPDATMNSQGMLFLDAGVKARDPFFSSDFSICSTGPGRCRQERFWPLAAASGRRADLLAPSGRAKRFGTLRLPRASVSSSPRGGLASLLASTLAGGSSNNQWAKARCAAIASMPISGAKRPGGQRLTDGPAFPVPWPPCALCSFFVSRATMAFSKAMRPNAALTSPPYVRLVCIVTSDCRRLVQVRISLPRAHMAHVQRVAVICMPCGTRAAGVAAWKAWTSKCDRACPSSLLCVVGR